MEDYYQILGVEKTASSEEIKRAYRKLAHQYHPDKGGSAEMAEKFKKANEAYQILSDPAKREQYDRFGKSGFSGNGFDQSGFSGGGFDFSGFSGGGFGGLNDIFETFFSQAFLTVQAEVEITPAQAILGDQLQISVGGEKITLEIPSGISSGSQFQFRGKGQVGRSGQRGDLIITVKIKIPKKVSPEEEELYQQIRDLEKQKTHRRGFWQR
jgi:curved DNA-binding protein